MDSLSLSLLAGAGIAPAATVIACRFPVFRNRLVTASPLQRRRCPPALRCEWVEQDLNLHSQRQRFYRPPQLTVAVFHPCIVAPARVELARLKARRPKRRVAARLHQRAGSTSRGAPYRLWRMTGAAPDLPALCVGIPKPCLQPVTRTVLYSRSARTRTVISGSRDHRPCH